jgi:hypothetical protein
MTALFALFAGVTMGVTMSKTSAMTRIPAPSKVLLGGKAAHSAGVKTQANSPDGPVISLHRLLAQLITSARYFRYLRRGFVFKSVSNPPLFSFTALLLILSSIN